MIDFESVSFAVLNQAQDPTQLWGQWIQNLLTLFTPLRMHLKCLLLLLGSQRREKVRGKRFWIVEEANVKANQVNTFSFPFPFSVIVSVSPL